jgi:hypothetical protein
MLAKIWRKRKPYSLLVECKLAQPLWKIVWRFPEKLKGGLPYDPAIPLLGRYTKEIRLVSQKYLHSHVYYRTIHNSHKMKTM